MGFGVLFYDYSPPLGVLLGKGLGWAFILNILLTILGYFRTYPRVLGSDKKLGTPQ